MLGGKFVPFEWDKKATEKTASFINAIEEHQKRDTFKDSIIFGPGSGENNKK